MTGWGTPGAGAESVCVCVCFFPRRQTVRSLRARQQPRWEAKGAASLPERTASSPLHLGRSPCFRPWSPTAQAQRGYCRVMWQTTGGLQARRGGLGRATGPDVGEQVGPPKPVVGSAMGRMEGGRERRAVLAGQVRPSRRTGAPPCLDRGVGFDGQCAEWSVGSMSHAAAAAAWNVRRGMRVGGGRGRGFKRSQVADRGTVGRVVMGQIGLAASSGRSRRCARGLGWASSLGSAASGTQSSVSMADRTVGGARGEVGGSGGLSKSRQGRPSESGDGDPGLGLPPENCTNSAWPRLAGGPWGELEPAWAHCSGWERPAKH